MVTRVDASESPVDPNVAWVVLTTGKRPAELARAVVSLLDDDCRAQVVVVSNGAGALTFDDRRVRVIESNHNLGAPGGRDLAVRSIDADIVGFLDDDAVLRSRATSRIRHAFANEAELGAVTFHLIDEDGDTQRRHVPRVGSGAARVGGEVALILEGASAIRRDTYLGVGGYFTDLVYAHEAVELCWRLVDRGWKIRYLADIEVFHPRTGIGRHIDGWRQTGRNRVWIARRTLPWPVAIVHILLWFAEGVRRAPGAEAKRSYVSGWWSGLYGHIDRAPITWGAVWRLTKLRRPPVV